MLTQAPATDEQQALSDIRQMKQSLLATTGLDYDKDLSPWLGNEITFALTDVDLDLDETNGEQPGYLLVAAIAPQKQREAREFLQLLWQRRALAGVMPQSQQISGVPILSGNDLNREPLSRGAFRGGEPSASALKELTAASAVVGDRFIVFANDVRVLRHSIRAAQSSMNLAQNRTYRETVARLSEQRVGLAYVNAPWLDGGSPDEVSRSARVRTAMSFELVPGGVVARLRRSDGRAIAADSAVSKSVAAMQFLPAASAWALSSVNLTHLLRSPKLIGLDSSELPKFLALGRPWQDSQSDDSGLSSVLPDSVLSQWAWAKGEYALGRVGNDWVLAVERNETGATQLDKAVREKGYSAVPVALDSDEADEETAEQGREAIAWTRFKAKPSYGAANSRLDTEVLGLHVQQGNYEIFASSLGAISQALPAPMHALRDAAQFEQAVDVLPSANRGYLYLNKAEALALFKQKVPGASRILKATEPLSSFVRSVSATQSREKDGETVSFFIQMSR